MNLPLRITENSYLCNEINEQDVVFLDKGMKMKVQPFTCGAQHANRLKVNNGGMNSIKKKQQEIKLGDPHQPIATMLLNEVDFVLHESMRNMMARDSFIH